MKKIIQNQKRFFRSGKTRHVSFRKSGLRRLYKGIKSKISLLEEALYEDLGKSPGEAYSSEIGIVLSEITFALKNLDQWAKPQRRPSAPAQWPGSCIEITQPLGVALIISPWNYPFMLVMAPLVGAIAAGNCCIIKPSEHAPATSAFMAKLVAKLFPPEYITVVEGGAETNKRLLKEKFDVIFFTGGSTVGKIVLRNAAENLTPVTLELGGKSPCIVEESANLSLAAKRIVFGKFINSGQTCVAPDYLLVQQSIKEEFLVELHHWIRTLFGEFPLSNPQYSRMVNIHHFQRVVGLLQKEKVIFGGKYDEKTLKIEPTVLTNVSLDAPIMQEEIFGPLLPVIPFTHISQVENYISSKDRPLALYLFTANKEIETRIMKGLSFGGGCVNDTILHLATPHMGFGGVGGSGYGRYRGEESYRTFSHTKSILKQAISLDFPFRYPPYTGQKNWLFRKILK